MPHRKLIALLALVLAAALAACGEKDEPAPGAAAGGARERLTLMLDWTPNPDHAAIYAAQQRGEYEKAGLDVRIVTPSDASAPLRILQGGRADVVVSYEPDVLLARDKGSDVVSVGALIQKPLVSLMSIKGSGVRTVKDLRGKRVGTSGLPYQSAYLKTILREARVPERSVRETNVGFGLVSAMVSRKVDATLAAFWNIEGVELKRRKKSPTIQRMETLGVPTYQELVFATRRSSLDAEFSSRLRRFLNATALGARAVVKDPKVGVDALLAAEPGLDRATTTAMVDATKAVMLPAGTRPFGWQDIDEWGAYTRWMLDNKLLKRRPSAAPPLTNEFLPGEGLQKASR